MNPDVPATSYENHEGTRTAVDHLRILLNELYSDPNPDIFTLNDFINRYPLTGLGDLATREIEQSQRINKSLNNYTHQGLCEFHVGLIYLYWGDHRGAAKQFDLARKNWSFAREVATSSLCYFAQGLSNSLALHYEDALRFYSLSEDALKRVSLKRHEFYLQEITTYIQSAQTQTRDAIWARLRAKPANEAAPKQATTQTPPPPRTNPPKSAPPKSAPPKPDPSDMPQPPDTPQPVSPVSTSPEKEGSILPPTTHLPSMPLPGHHQPDQGYVWYQVEKSVTGNLFDDVLDGDWLLVNTTLADDMNVEKNEFVLVSMEKDLGNATRIRSNRATGPFKRIYLAKNDTNFIGAFDRDLETGDVSLIKVTFSSQDQQISVQWSAIIGVVEGFWRNIQYRQST